MSIAELNFLRSSSIKDLPCLYKAEAESDYV